MARLFYTLKADKPASFAGRSTINRLITIEILMSNHINTTISFLSMTLLALLLLVVPACRSMPQHSEQDLLCSMEKTTCFGTCPAYELKIYSDGWAQLTGTAHTPYLGTYQLKLSPKDVLLVKKAFKDASFFDLDEKYYANVSDLPTTYVYYQDGDRSKKVMDYHGAPPNLKQLEAYLSTFLDRKWKRSKPQ